MRGNTCAQAHATGLSPAGFVVALLLVFGASSASQAATIYVEKFGADSSTCGSAADPCLTITGTDGAFAKITANDDNGFATCSDDHDQGCGQCDGNGTAARNTACNEDADCGSGGTCTALTCDAASSDAGEACLINSDCNGGTGGHCDNDDNNSDRCTAGICQGPQKAYTLRFGSGTWFESLNASDDGQVPSPGWVALQGVGQSTVIRGETSNCTLDLTDREAVGLLDINLLNVTSSGNALCSTGNARNNISIQSVFQTLGPTAWPIHFSGRGNITNSFVDSRAGTVFSAASGNGVYFESWQQSCSNDRTRACFFDANCSGGSCDGLQSHDFAWVGGRIQVNGGTSAGGTAFEIVAKACGSAWNIIIDGVPIHGTNVGGTPPRKGLVIRQEDCSASSVGSLKNALDVIVRDVQLTGTSQVGGGFLDFDTPVEVGADTRLHVLGPFSYDACSRVVNGTLSYATSGEFGGGLSHLGVLNCSAPVSPVDGESWYDDVNDVLEAQIGGSIMDLSFVPEAPIMVTQDNSEVIQDDTTLDADDLFVGEADLDPNTPYLVEGIVFYESHSSADFKFALELPDTGAEVRIGVDVVQTGGTFKEFEVVTDETEINHSTSNSATYAANLKGTLSVGSSTTGGFGFKWAQKSSQSEDTKVLQGSWIRLTKTVSE